MGTFPWQLQKSVGAGLKRLLCEGIVTCVAEPKGAFVSQEYLTFHGLKPLLVLVTPTLRIQSLSGWCPYRVETLGGGRPACRVLRRDAGQTVEVPKGWS